QRRRCFFIARKFCRNRGLARGKRRIRRGIVGAYDSQRCNDRDRNLVTFLHGSPPTVVTKLMASRGCSTWAKKNRKHASHVPHSTRRIAPVAAALFMAVRPIPRREHGDRAGALGGIPLQPRAARPPTAICAQLDAHMLVLARERDLPRAVWQGSCRHLGVGVL